ncbi:MAG: hypothetical protein JJ866_20285 [Roseibium sp.]|uniref:hypothetical protein n=1 Tax=Roseibium sp. TaxID=1936156 RepID=UPI001B1EE8BC|nr:hypothetical protein [Roseibium sp.]MBO6894293.1 hypothetical protein [Roseibium sp.]MBO6930913.1 hypothetical protein [Roseibium sp.]
MLEPDHRVARRRMMVTDMYNKHDELFELINQKRLNNGLPLNRARAKSEIDAECAIPTPILIFLQKFNQRALCATPAWLNGKSHQRTVARPSAMSQIPFDTGKSRMKAALS